MNRVIVGLCLLAAFFFSCTSTPRVASVKLPSIPVVEDTVVELLPRIDVPIRIGKAPVLGRQSQSTVVGEILVPQIVLEPTPTTAVATLPSVDDRSKVKIPESPSTTAQTIKGSGVETVGQEVKSTVVKPNATPTAKASPAAVAVARPTPSAKPTPAAKPTETGTKVVTPSPSPKSSPQWQVPVPLPSATSPLPSPNSLSLLPAQERTAADVKWEEINAKVGDDVYIQFNKVNWIFLEPKDASQKAGFVESRREANGTSFLFRPRLLGTYELEFQRQDLSTGSTETRKVRLTAYDPKARLSDSSATNPQLSATPRGNFFDQTPSLIANGQSAQAVQKLLQNYKPEDTKLNLQLAQLLTQSQQDLEALKYLDRNLNRTSSEFVDSLTLATQLASKSDKSRLGKYLQLWLDTKSIPTEPVYFQALEAIALSPSLPTVAPWLDSYLAWYPVPQERDRYLFAKAKYFESAGPQRNVQTAWELYRQIVAEYPLSEYWTLAGERASYLKRHFLQAR